MKGIITPRTCLAAVILSLLTCAPAPSAPTASALLHRLQEALGGADSIAAVYNFDQTVRGVSFDGNTGQRIGEVRKRVRWVKPNHLRLDQVGPGNTYVLYFDGVGGWEILPDGSVHDLEAGELQFAQGYLRGFPLKTMLADRDPAYTISSPAPNVLRIVHKESDATRPADLTLDPSSWLPLKETSTSYADPAHPVDSETQYGEWKEVQGIRFAYRFKKLHGGAHVADAVIEATVLNSGLQVADLEAKPPDLEPAMGLSAVAASSSLERTPSIPAPVVLGRPRARYPGSR
jgi:hypothetical protein